MRRKWNGYYEHLDQRDSFAEFDRDHDGKLDRKETGGLIACVLGIDVTEKKVCFRLIDAKVEGILRFDS